MNDSPLRVHKLIRRLQAPKYMMRLHAGCLLGQMGAEAKEAVPTLLSLLRSGEAPDRKLAAWTLGYLGGAAVEATVALQTAAQDSEESVRLLAASALEKIRAATAPAAAA